MAEVTWKPGAQLCGPLVSCAAQLWDVKSRGSAGFEAGAGLSSARQQLKVSRDPTGWLSLPGPGSPVNTSIKYLCICMDYFPRRIQRAHLVCIWGPGGVCEESFRLCWPWDGQAGPEGLVS